MNLRAMRTAAGLTQAELARAAQIVQPNLSAYENGRRRPSPEVLERILTALRGPPSERVSRHREEILAAVARNKAHSPRLLGSVARGDDHPESDVDLLVDFEDGASLLDLIGLQLELEELLGVDVDVIDAGGLRGSFGDRVNAEKVPL